MNRRLRWVAYLSLLPLAGVLSYLIVWLLNKRRQNLGMATESIELPEASIVPESQARPAPGDWVSQASGEPTEPEPAPPAQEVRLEADDLTKIKGIGPKIARVLGEAGIVRYAQLAGMKPVEIEAVLQAAQVRLANPESWPAQARLAADAQWEALNALQDELRAGRA